MTVFGATGVLSDFSQNAKDYVYYLNATDTTIALEDLNNLEAVLVGNDGAFKQNVKYQTIDGETITSDCFADSKLTMLNVWATYCNPCLREMPDLGELAVSYDSSDFQMLGAISDISVFSEADAIAAAVELIEKTGATTYPHLLLNESLYQNLIGGVDSVPTTFFINNQGELLGYVVGSQSKETWKGLIDELLAEMD
jgi:thiol-disulfide isomerase/thioredoxin